LLQIFQYFLWAAQLLMNQTRAAVSSMVASFPNYEVVMTGHSLGGSLAVLLGYDLVQAGVVKKPPTVYTFGQPRTGSFEFASAVMATLPNCYRLTHYQDLVAHLPPCPTDWGLCVARTPANGTLWTYHHQTEVFYPQEAMPSAFTSATGNYKTCTGTPAGEDAACSDGLPWTLSIDDHKVYFTVPVGTYCPESVINIAMREAEAKSRGEWETSHPISPGDRPV